MNGRGADELILVETEDGTLAIGGNEALDAWAASAGEVAIPTPAEKSTVAAVADVLPDVVEMATMFIRRRSGSTELRRVTRGADGRYTSNALVAAAVVTNPELLVIQAAVGAVSAALGDLQESLERVTDGVDELLRAADADRLGDVYGRHRILRRMVGDLLDGRRLSTADWEAIAALGPELEVGTERLRRHLLGQLRDVDAQASVRRRARQLRKLADNGRVGDLLRLLVAAEETLHNYQRLRLVRIRDTEPEAVDQTVDSVRRILNDNLIMDNQVAEALMHVLNEVAVIRPAEGWDVLTRRGLDQSREALAADVGQFLIHRHQQAEQWELADSAGVREALAHYRGLADSAADSTRRVAAKGLDRLARRIDPS